MTEIDKILLGRAERIEERPDGRYAIISAGKLSADEFAVMIMRDVRELQSKRAEVVA